MTFNWRNKYGIVCIVQEPITNTIHTQDREDAKRYANYLNGVAQPENLSLVPIFGSKLI